MLYSDPFIVQANISFHWVSFMIQLVIISHTEKNSKTQKKIKLRSLFDASFIIF